MASFHRCLNGRALIVSDEENICQAIDGYGIVPCVTLITAWAIDAVNLRARELLVKNLLAKGCRYFVCTGTYGEKLHDFIDDIVVYKEDQTIVTTWHDDETPEDIVYFFVNLTDIWEEKRGGLVAVLDESIFGDQLIKEALMKELAAAPSA